MIEVSQSFGLKSPAPNFVRDNVSELDNNTIASQNYPIGHLVYLNVQKSYDGKIFQKGVYQYIDGNKDTTHSCWKFLRNEKGELADDVTHYKKTSNTNDIKSNSNMLEIFDKNGNPAVPYTSVKAVIDPNGKKLDSIINGLTTSVNAKIEKSNIADDFQGGVGKVLSADKGKQLNTELTKLNDEAVRVKDVDKQIASIDSTLIENAIRKTPQELTESEKTIARHNIGTLSEAEIIALIKRELQK